ncbi:MAG TPA: hypothetical protein VD886_04185 [Herpetosiphonaceae bacterium]|nr:hypothetical protein [Herpetosiphonaceae bacterium]
MRELRIPFRCYHPDCADEQPTEIIVHVPATPTLPQSIKEKFVYCTRNHLNIIDLPNTVDANYPVYGDDEGGQPSGSSGIVPGRQP